MIRLRCPKHPYYSGQKPPRASCEYCIAMWEIVLKPRNARLIYIPSKTNKPGPQKHGQLIGMFDGPVKKQSEPEKTIDQMLEGLEK